MALKTRKPTGRAPWPLVLVEGPEKSGKSWCAAAFSASPRIGQMYWLDLGEGAADEYGAIPGARYLVVEHDGTWTSILGSVEAIRDEAARAADAGEPPVALAIDSMTAEWDLLKDWATNRAKGRKTNQDKLRRNPDAEVQISMDLWNDANSRHRKLMTILMTFPGIVVVTARGKEVAALDSGGRPVEGSKEYKVEGQKTIGFDATVWVRMSRDHPPMIIGARSVHAGIRPGVDKPKPAPQFTLDWLVFDLLKCNPADVRTRDLVELKPGTDAPDEASPRALALSFAVDEAPDQDALRKLWTATGSALKAGEVTQAEADSLGRVITAAKAGMEQAGMAPPTNGSVPEVTEAQHRRMHALWRDLKLGGNEHRDHRLARTGQIVGRPDDKPLQTSAELTHEEAQRVIRVLDEEVKALQDVLPNMTGAAA